MPETSNAPETPRNPAEPGLGAFLAHKHKGARAELCACAWLLQQGYEVFRNVSPFGEVDVVAFRGGKVALFDIKSRSSDKVRATLTRRQLEMGVLPIYVFPSGEVEIDFEPDFRLQEVNLRRICGTCGQQFAMSRRHQVYCSRDCSRLRGKAAA